MAKLAHVSNAHSVSAPASRGAVAKRRANNARKIDPAWVEFADHVVAEKLPFVAIGIELGRSVTAGRLSWRAVLLIAALAL